MNDRFRAREGLLWRCWDDEYVVYNPASGDSHYLDYLSGEGLRRLEQRAMNGAELAGDLSRALDVPADDALSRYVDRMLASFAELGLTRPAAT